jgi:hypothetical protein
MARKPNYQFERAERDRQKAAKAAEKARLKQEAKDANRPPDSDASDDGDGDGQD